MSKFIRIPEGKFIYSRSKNEENVGSFYMDECTITSKIWNMTASIANSNGYDICLATGEDNLPAGNITWFDCVKLCNALSEIFNKKCVYYTSSDKNEIYKSGYLSIDSSCVDENADGFRIPTQIQWEYACKAGSSTYYFWGDRVDYSYMHSNSPVLNETPVHEVGKLKPNNFGLYDMSGNVYEWCFDKYKKFRVLRGGSIALDSDCSSGKMNYSYPDYHCYETGVRLCLLSNKDENIDLSLIKADNQIKLLPTDFGYSNQYTAQNFFDMIDLTKSGLENVKSCIEKNEYNESLKKFRDYYIKKILKRNEVLKPSWAAVPPNKNELDHVMSYKGDINWFVSEKNPDIITRHINLYSLYYMWEQTGEEKYLSKWIEFLNSKALYFKEEFDRLPYSAYSCPNSYGRPQSWDGYMGFNESGIEMIAYLNNVILKMTDKELEKYITPELIKNILLFCVWYNIYVIIKDSRSSIGNQMIFTNKILLTLSDFLSEFKDSKIWFDIAIERLSTEWINNSYMEDGSDMEQGYNYNAGLIRDFILLKKIIGDRAPDFITKVDKCIKYRHRMLSLLIQPFGGKPAGASCYGVYPPLLNDKTRAVTDDFIRYDYDSIKPFSEDEVAYEITDTLLKEKSDNKLMFTTAVLPYSGYYIFRDAWKRDSLYMCFLGTRCGKGHCAENSNSVSVVAYGRNFLISCGAHSYKSPDYIAYDQIGYIDLIDQYQVTSPGWNTVLTDGFSQKRYSGGENQLLKAYNNTVPNRFFTSDNIDYAENTYNDGYGDENIDIDASHTRQVFFLRKLKLWVITDEMKSQNEHTYTQVWNLPGKITHEFSQSIHPKLQHFNSKDIYNYDIAGFYDTEIKVDENSKMIYTVQKNAPNLFMYHISDEKLSYSRYFGSLNPTAGWQSPGFKSRRFPKTDVHTSWKGNKLITLVVPSPDEKSIVNNITRKENSFFVETKNGSFTFSNKEYSKENLHILAKSIIVADNYGVVLECSRFMLNNVLYETPADFGFSVSNGMVEFSKINIPTGFMWTQDTQGYNIDYGN